MTSPGGGEGVGLRAGRARPPAAVVAAGEYVVIRPAPASSRYLATRGRRRLAHLQRGLHHFVLDQR